MKTRLIVAAILIAVTLPIMIIGGIASILLITAIFAISLYEAVTAREESKNWSIGIKVFCILAPLLMVYWGFIINFVYNVTPLYSSFQRIEIPTLGIATLLVVLFLIVIIDSNVEVADATYLFTMIILLTLTGKSFIYICLKSPDNFRNRLLPILFVTCVTFMTDTGGYFIGKFFGKHKINPRISPKKTVEGMIGASAFGLITSIIFCIPFIRLEDYNLFSTIFVGILITAGAQVGDFLFSSIKRFYKIKDFGKILPGHGGFLDRIDSLIIGSIIFVIFDSLVVRYSNGEQDLIVFLLGLF